MAGEGIEGEAHTLHEGQEVGGGALGGEGGAAFFDGGGVGGVETEGDGDDGEAGEAADGAVAGGEGVGWMCERTSA